MIKVTSYKSISYKTNQKIIRSASPTSHDTARGRIALLDFDADELADVAVPVAVDDEDELFDDEEEEVPLPATPMTAEPAQSPLVPLLPPEVPCTTSDDASTVDPDIACACTYAYA